MKEKNKMAVGERERIQPRTPRPRSFGTHTNPRISHGGHRGSHLFKQGAGSAFSVILYKIANVRFLAIKVYCKTVNAQKFFGKLVYQFAVNGRLVSENFFTAIQTGFHAFFTLHLNTRHSWGPMITETRSVKKPITSCFQQSYNSRPRPEA